MSHVEIDRPHNGIHVWSNENTGFDDSHNGAAVSILFFLLSLYRPCHVLIGSFNSSSSNNIVFYLSTS